MMLIRPTESRRQRVRAPSGYDVAASQDPTNWMPLSGCWSGSAFSPSAHVCLRGAWCTLHVALPCCALSGGWNVAALVASGATDREARQHCMGIEPCACKVTCSASRSMFARCHLRAMAPARTVAACAISRSKAHRCGTTRRQPLGLPKTALCRRLLYNQSLLGCLWAYAGACV
jgi:hypothetical protein